MSSAIHELVHTVLEKSSLQECNVQELQELVHEFPYSSSLHLILIRKMQGADTDAFNSQLEKSSLYFTDRLWLDHILNQTGDALVEKKDKEEKTTRVFEPSFTAERTVAVDELVVHEQSPVRTEKKIPVLETAGHSGIEPDDIETEAGDKLKEEATMAEQSLPLPVDESTESSTEETEGVEEPGQENLQAMPPLKIEPIDLATAELTFEPFHTVDYFASQGIKFSEEEKPKDKFGQQLKSFTEWLKTIKKSPAQEISAAALVAPEEKVEKLAEHSLAEREIITEAMAQVWEKQGKPEKAIAIYGKLSLLNPSKSSYFAAKIEHLKQS